MENELYKEIDRLKAENERLKDYVEDFEVFFVDFYPVQWEWFVKYRTRQAGKEAEDDRR